jgi:hypothetical protein
VPHAVSEADTHWYADIAITPPGATPYKPFVRLAVARYQQHSLPGLTISTIVTTDLVPLLPRRRLVVERTAGGAEVTITGPGPNTPNRYEVILESCDSPVAAWHPVGSPITARVGTTSSVPLPTGTASMRLRVQEIEDVNAVGALPHPPELTRRTVFLDLVDLPPAWTAP